MNDLLRVVAEMRKTVETREMCQGVTQHSRRIAGWADRLESLAQPPHGGVAEWQYLGLGLHGGAEWKRCAADSAQEMKRQGYDIRCLYTHPAQPLSAAEREALEMFTFYVECRANTPEQYKTDFDVKARALLPMFRRLAAPPVVEDGGNYECICATCRKHFIGPKRSVTCDDCKAPPEPVGAGDGVNMKNVLANVETYRVTAANCTAEANRIEQKYGLPSTTPAAPADDAMLDAGEVAYERYQNSGNYSRRALVRNIVEAALSAKGERWAIGR